MHGDHDQQILTENRFVFYCHTDRLLDVIIEMVDIFKDSEDGISDSGVDSVLAATAAIALDMDPQYNADLFTKIEYDLQ